MINILKKSSLIMFHRSGIGYAVVEHKLIPLNFEELEVEDVKYIFENGKEVKYDHDIRWQTRGKLFEYTIHNGYGYEFAEYTNLYSEFFFTPEEFAQMCEEAYKELYKEYPDELDIAKKVKENHPGVFVKLNMGTGWSIPREDD